MSPLFGLGSVYRQNPRYQLRCPDTSHSDNEPYDYPYRDRSRKSPILRGTWYFLVQTSSSVPTQSQMSTQVSATRMVTPYLSQRRRFRLTRSDGVWYHLVPYSCQCPDEDLDISPDSIRTDNDPHVCRHRGGPREMFTPIPVLVPFTPISTQTSPYPDEGQVSVLVLVTCTEYLDRRFTPGGVGTRGRCPKTLENGPRVVRVVPCKQSLTDGLTIKKPLFLHGTRPLEDKTVERLQEQTSKELELFI